MNKIIVMFKDEDKELNMSLYDFIDEQYRKAIPIMVCYVTERQYANMREQLEKLGYLYERTTEITPFTPIGYNRLRYVIGYDLIENNLLISDYGDPKKIGSYRIDADGIHYDEKGYQITNHPSSMRFFSYTIKVYTTESYEEIIAHYKGEKAIDEEIIDNHEGTEAIDELIKQKTKELIELIGHHCRTCNTPCCGGFGDNNSCSKWSHIIS